MTGNSPNWHDVDTLAEAFFVARDTLDTLTAASHVEAPPMVSFHDIYSYAMINTLPLAILSYVVSE